MTTELLHIPFEPGLTDSVDRAMIGGKLYQAENVRFRKQGRVVKRYGVARKDFFSGATGVPNAVGQINGQSFLVAAQQMTLGELAGAVQMPFRLSRVLPRKAEVVFCDQTGASSITRGDCSQHDTNRILYAYDNDTSMGYAVHNNDGSIVLQTQSSTGGRYCRCLSSPGWTVSNIIRNHGGTIKGFSINKATNAVSGDTTIDTAASSTSALDAYVDSTGTIYLAFQKTATSIRVLGLNAGLSTLASWDVTVTGVARGIRVINVVSGNIYVAYTLVNGHAYHFATDLTADSGETVIDNNASFDYHGQPGVVLTKPGVLAPFIVVISGIDTASTARVTRVCYVNLAINPLTLTIAHALSTFWNCSLASQPFAIGERYCAWVATDNDLQATTGWEIQRGYWMIDLLDSNQLPTATPAPVMNGAPLVAFIPATATNPEPVNLLPNAIQVGTAPTYWTCPLVDVKRTRPSLTSTGTLGDYGLLNAVSWFDASQNDPQYATLYARRSWVEANGAAYFAGGFVAEYDGTLHESGFAHYPAVIVATAIAGGVGAATGTFSFAHVYEWNDALGRRHRSSPSDPQTLVVGQNLKLRSLVSTLAFGKGTQDPNFYAGGVIIHEYRTDTGGTIYYRTTSNLSNGVSAAPVAGSATATIDDSMVLTGASLAAREILYTNGGVLPNICPPAARYLAVGGNRLWLAGLLLPRRVVASKLFVTTEAVAFSNSAAFQIELPEDITGIAWGDGQLIVFTERSIYLVGGDGPNDEGSGAFGTPQRLPSDIGCIEHHSIVETQDGWMFQSRRGIYLLPRGFGEPQFIGADIQDTLASYPIVRNAVRVVEAGYTDSGENSVHYLLQNPAGTSRIVVWDTSLRKWVSVDTFDNNDIALVGRQDNRRVTVRSPIATGYEVLQESATGYASDTGGFIKSRLRTGQIRPFDLLGTGNLDKLGIIGEIQAPADLYTTISTDGTSGVALTVSTKSGVSGDRWYHRHNPPNLLINSLDVEIWDQATAPCAGLVFNGLTVEYDGPIPGLPRLSSKDTT